MLGRRAFIVGVRTLLGLALAASTCGAEAPRVLRVAMHADNPPFSNVRGEGFENRLAELFARELHARLDYVWCSSATPGVGEMIRAGAADVAIGVPTGFRGMLTTRPYYTSTYLFIHRRGAFPIRSFDDPALRIMRVGVAMIGGQASDVLPVHALAARGYLENIRGYAAFESEGSANPTAAAIQAVARGEIDLAVAWGPVAGYFAAQERVRLEMTPVLPEADGAGLHFVFSISVGVHPGNRALRAELDAILARCRMEVIRILDEFAVPRVAPLESAVEGRDVRLL